MTPAEKVNLPTSVLALAALGAAVALPSPLGAQTPEDVDVALHCFEIGQADSATCLEGRPSIYLMWRTGFPLVIERLLDGLETIALTADEQVGRDAVERLGSFGRQPSAPVPTLPRLRRIYESSTAHRIKYAAVHYAAMQPDSQAVAEFLGEVATSEHEAPYRYSRQIPLLAIVSLIQMGSRADSVLEALEASASVTAKDARDLLHDHLLRPGDIDWHAASACFAATVHQGEDECRTYYSPDAKSLREYLDAGRFTYDVIGRALDMLATMAARWPDPLVRRAAVTTISARGDVPSEDHMRTLEYLERIYRMTSRPEVCEAVLWRVPHHPTAEAVRFLGRVASGKVASGELASGSYEPCFATPAVDGLSRLGDAGRAELQRLRQLPILPRGVRTHLEVLEDHRGKPLGNDLRAARICFEAVYREPCAPGIYSLEHYLGADFDSTVVEAALDTLAAVAIQSWSSDARGWARITIIAYGQRSERAAARVFPRLGWIALEAEDRYVRREALWSARTLGDTARLVELLTRVASGPPDLEATSTVEGNNSVPALAVGLLHHLGDAGQEALARLEADDAVRDPVARGRLAEPSLLVR